MLHRYALGFAIVAVVCGLLAIWAHRQPTRDTRPLPRPMRAWFVVYILILVPAGIALLRGVPGVMPWPVKPEASMIYGWVFLAAVCSFLYPLLRPRVEYAAVGLWGFLAYDAVLLVPFFKHLRTVKPELFGALVLYIAVLVLTAAISLWYLFFSRATRFAVSSLPIAPAASRIDRIRRTSA